MDVVLRQALLSALMQFYIRHYSLSAIQYFHGHASLRSVLVFVLAVILAMITADVRAQPLQLAQAPQGSGVKVDEPSRLRNLVPAEQLEQAATRQFNQMKQEAAKKNALAGDDHPQLIRLRTIASHLLPHTPRWNPDSKRWAWEVQLFGSQAINAFCMPGGKIGFYMGILEKLKLTDDEVAMIMGHEMAHALREHSRERLAKNQLTGIGAGLLSSILGLGDVGRVAIDYGAQLTMLKFSRDDESEADLIGMDIAARAGYDPRAGVSLWRKMSAASKNAPPQWLSTHPSGKNRIAEIEKHLPAVMPLYMDSKGLTTESGSRN